jgi:hypothetical protein
MARKKIVSRGKMFVDPTKKGTILPGSGPTRIYAGTIKAEWTCGSCDQPHIPGDEKNCPSCGNPKEDTEVYQAPTSPGPILTAKELAEMGVDPKQHFSDETCPSCFSKLKPGTTVCPHCGSTVNDTAYTKSKCPNCGRETNGDNCLNCGGQTAPKYVAPVTPRASLISSFSNRLPIRETPNLLTIFGVLAVLVFVCAILGFLFWPRQTTMRVSDVFWVRTINLQEKQHIHKEGWSLPAGAENVSTTSQFHHNEPIMKNICEPEKQVVDHEKDCHTKQVEVTNREYVGTEPECYDDGTCEYIDVYDEVTSYEDKEVCIDKPVYGMVNVCEDRKVGDTPIYQDYYSYNVWEWVNINSAEASGHNLQPQWPSVATSANVRSSGQSESLTVVFVNEKNQQYRYAPSDATEFQNYTPGSVWEVKYNSVQVTEVIERNPQ